MCALLSLLALILFGLAFARGAAAAPTSVTSAGDPSEEPHGPAGASVPFREEPHAGASAPLPSHGVAMVAPAASHEHEATATPGGNRNSAPSSATPRGMAVVSPAEMPSDHATPRRVMDLFLRACKVGDYERAAQFLDLRALPTLKRASEGSKLAHDLKIVLERKLWIDLSKLSDQPEGDPTDVPGTEVIGTIFLNDEAVPLALTRSKPEANGGGWLIAKSTVAMIPQLYTAYGDPWLASRMPPALVQIRLFENALWQWLGLGLSILIGFGVGHLVGRSIGGVFERLFRRSRAPSHKALAQAARGPLRWVIALVMIKALITVIGVTVPVQLVVDHIDTSLLLIAIAAFIIRIIQTGTNAFTARLPEDTAGEMQSRGIRTRLLVARRVASILVGTITVAVLLIQFDFVRSVGMSLLASAGIAGVVIGFAAQKSLAGLIAGIQLSITQPMRIGDVVVIENEWGKVEEINLTYVVVKVWDERRVIVPISRCLEQPFQNWSKMGSQQMLGTVEVYADMTLPLEETRAELVRLCKAHPLWDKRVANLQVTNTTERSIMLRALISTFDNSKLFDFRCDIREGLVSFVNTFQGGKFLPRERLQPIELPSSISRIVREPHDNDRPSRSNPVDRPRVEA